MNESNSTDKVQKVIKQTNEYAHKKKKKELRTNMMTVNVALS